MSVVAELIRRADERLRSQVGVATGLTDAVTLAGLDQIDSPDKALMAARALLADRRQALVAAQRRVGQLDDTVARLVSALPFLEEGWPFQRDRLLDAFRDDPEDGLADWLDYWFSAASSRRLGALRRLHADVPLPGHFKAIGERLSVAARALAEDDWLPCHETLLLGVAGVLVGTREVPDRPGPDGREPDDQVREDLRLLAARLALHNGLHGQADTTLKGLDTAPRLALRSWVARLAGKSGDAESLLAKARDLDPYDLDVTVESIAGARQCRDMYDALDVARAAVAALPSLADIDGDIGRLVGPPPEIWVALAERAWDEDDHDSGRRFLDRAAAATAREDYVVLAAAEEARATAAASDAERRRARLLAGYWSAEAGRLDRARRNYEAAAGNGIPADPADIQVQAAARLRLADVIAVTARQRPLHTVGEELRYALGLVLEARPRAGWIGAESWSYLTESDLRVQRSRVPDLKDQERREQEWGALLAAAQAVLSQPRGATAWLGLAEAAMTRDLYLVAEAAAERAYEIEQTEATRVGYVRALINVGRYRDALELLGDADESGNPWRQCIRGLIALRRGQADEAVQHFTGLRIDPMWLWAWNAHVRALVIMGDAAAGRLKSAELMRAGADRADERSWLAVAAFDARLNGKFDAALSLAGSLSHAAGPGDFRTLYARGEAQVLKGDQAGWNVLAEALAADPRPAAVDVWEREELPVLQALAVGQGITLTPPAQLPSRVPAKDPATELWQAAEAATVSDAKDAARLTAAALRIHTAARDTEGHRATAALREPPTRGQPVVRLRVPGSWRAREDAGPELGELLAWAEKWVEVSETEDLEPDGYQLLVGNEVHASGHAVLAPRPVGEHDLKALATQPDAEVIAGACYRQIPPTGPLPLTVPLLAHRCWVLRGMPEWSEKPDWEVAERVLGQFIAEDAYFLWEKRGRPLFADPLADWLAAEHEVKQTGIVPGVVVDDRLRFQIALQGAYFNGEKRGRSFGSPLTDWPS